MFRSGSLRTDAAQVLLLCGRQMGKSSVSAALALSAAVLAPDSPVLLLSPSDRQSAELFRKVVGLYDALGRPVPSTSRTARRLELANGSRVVSLPGGIAPGVAVTDGFRNDRSPWCWTRAWGRWYAVQTIRNTCPRAPRHEAATAAPAQPDFAPIPAPTDEPGPTAAGLLVTSARVPAALTRRRGRGVGRRGAGRRRGCRGGRRRGQVAPRVFKTLNRNETAGHCPLCLDNPAIPLIPQF